MDSKKYIVFNKTRDSFLSSSVTPVNAALEPLKVLKVLIEGLPANARTGLWLTNFKGVPVARTLSPFDLVYLNKDHRIVHSVELSKDGEFAPFKGQPASALVLPPRTITSSKTRDGDELELRVAEATGSEPSSASGPTETAPEPRAATTAVEQAPPVPAEAASSARFYSSTTPAPAAPLNQAPLERFVSEQAAASPVASARAETATKPTGPPAPEPASAPSISPIAPAEVASAATAPEAPTLDKRRRLVTGPILTPSSAAAKKPATPETPATPKAPIPFPSTPAARSAVTIQEASPPINLSPQQRGSAKPQEAPPTAVPPPTPPQPPVRRGIRVAPAVAPSPQASAAPQAPAAPSEPQPTLPAQTESVQSEAPAAVPEIPQYDTIPDYGPPPPKRKYSWKIHVLRWLFPELVIHEASRPRDRRRADRQSLPGLIAYFFTGGAPEPRRIRNISVTGFYLQTEDRWMPGTVVRMTLQKLGSKGDDPSDTITVNSRIVRWGPDGEGFEFILTDLEE